MWDEFKGIQRDKKNLMTKVKHTAWSSMFCAYFSARGIVHSIK